MFVSSSASAAIASDLEDGCRFSVGLGIRRDVNLGGDDLVQKTDVVKKQVDELGSNVDLVVTVFGDVSEVAMSGGADGIDRVRLVSRSRFQDHVDVLREGSHRRRVAPRHRRGVPGNSGRRRGHSGHWFRTDADRR